MTREEIKNRLKAGESVEFIVYETGKSFDDIYEIFEECKKEGYIKVHHFNRLKRRIPNGKLVFVPQMKDHCPAVYINIDKITSIVISDDKIMVYTNEGFYYINEEVLDIIVAKMGVV